MEEKLKMLIVDDEEAIVDWLERIYKRKGFRVYGTTDGKTAVELYKQNNPHICLIDIHMPYSPLDGIEVLGKIKELKKDAVCIMLTRITEEEKIKKAKELGALHYITKPLSLEELDKVIEEVASTFQV